MWEVEEFLFLHHVGDSDEAGQQIWKDVWEELVPGGGYNLYPNTLLCVVM